VIGSGATGIQVVPKLQPGVKSLEVYVRSPTYILPSVGFGVESSTFNEPCQSKSIISRVGLELIAKQIVRKKYNTSGMTKSITKNFEKLLSNK
jgi:cation diffusion facilitator CzcD-associated flavoprotein CzcO